MDVSHIALTVTKPDLSLELKSTTFCEVNMKLSQNYICYLPFLFLAYY